MAAVRVLAKGVSVTAWTRQTQVVLLNVVPRANDMYTDVFHVHLHLLCSCHKHAYMSDLKENVLLAVNNYCIDLPSLIVIGSHFLFCVGWRWRGDMRGVGCWWRAWKGKKGNNNNGDFVFEMPTVRFKALSNTNREWNRRDECTSRYRLLGS